MSLKFRFFNKIRLIETSLAIFTFLASIVAAEVFFRMNETHHWISEHTRSRILSSVRSTQTGVRTISFEELKKKYPGLAQKIPDRFQSENDYPWNEKFENPRNPRTVYSDNYLQTYYDPSARANKTYEISRLVDTERGEKIAYKTFMTFDEFGARKVPEKKIDADAKHVLTIGCSFTVGEGVNFGKDYPGQLSQKIGSHWSVHNFGFNGYGPADFYHSIVNHEDSLKFLKDKDVTVIWLLYPFQFERSFCSLRCLSAPTSSWIYPKPFYKFDESKNEVVYQGDFETTGAFPISFARFLSNSSILRFFGVDFPLWQSEAASAETAEYIFASIKRRLERTMRVSRFVVVNMQSNKESELLGPSLKKHDIQYLDYAGYDPLAAVSERKTIPYDGHPTPEYYWALTELLKQDLFQE